MSAKNQTSKPWWRQLLNPGWIIAAIVVGIFSYFAFTFLAPWQLGKNEQLVERNEHISAAFDRDPEPLVDRLPGTTLAPADEWSRVVATGHYTGNDVLLRLRSVDRTPAFQVLTPFTLDDGRTILVNRGWVPAEGSTGVPDIDAAPTGDVTITGMLRAGEAVHPTAPIHDQGYDMVHSINPAQVGELAGVDAGAVMVEPYLQLLSDQPGTLTAIPLPQLETGNHLSYGLQWILFGVAAPGALLYFLFSESRERRRYVEEQKQLLNDDTVAGSGPEPSPVPGEETAPAPSAQTPTAAPTRSRQRYGSSRTNPWAKAYDKEQER
ncbi:SURF1 family cytochrome oxidase biogenesis protein [Corynebacterium coyleae]